jgi:radical SAM protein with 4Fe4S-binding SPASM domain
VNHIVKALQRYAWRGYVRAAARSHELRYLFWETTLRCNLACRHCGSSCAKHTALPDELTTAEVKQVFDTLARDYNPKRITVAVTGGEPLLRPDVFEVAAHFALKGFRWGMVSNGILFTDEAVRLAQAAGMGSVSISLDGLKPEHEYLRGQGTFEHTLAGIKRLRDAQFLGILEVVCCPTARVVERLDEYYAFLCELGIDQFRLLPIAPMGRAKHARDLLLDGSSLKHLLDWIRAKRADKTAPLPVTLDEEGWLGEPYEREVRELPYFCFAGVHAASILANGDIGPCPSVHRDFVQGNVRQQRFSEVWERGFTEFRDRSWMRQGKCAHCPSFTDCLGNSFHLWDGRAACEPGLCHLELLRSVAEHAAGKGAGG